MDQPARLRCEIHSGHRKLYLRGSLNASWFSLNELSSAIPKLIKMIQNCSDSYHSDTWEASLPFPDDVVDQISHGVRVQGSCDISAFLANNPNQIMDIYIITQPHEITMSAVLNGEGLHSWFVIYTRGTMSEAKVEDFHNMGSEMRPRKVGTYCHHTCTEWENDVMVRYEQIQETIQLTLYADQPPSFPEHLDIYSAHADYSYPVI